MIKAGPERDKVIAEIRGDAVGGFDEGCNAKPYSDTICGVSCANCDYWGIKPYSTDIATAMELELPTNYYEITRRGKKVKAACWVTHNPEGFHHESEWHDTEAAAMSDARSGVWLKWKESA